MSFPFAGIAAVAGNGIRPHSTYARRHQAWLSRVFFILFLIGLMLIPHLSRKISSLTSPLSTGLPLNGAGVRLSTNTSVSHSGNRATENDPRKPVEFQQGEIRVEGNTLTKKDHLGDPCIGRPTPKPIPGSNPPVLFFLHIPKTAGTLMYDLVKQYANRTNGLACQFLFDGNRCTHSEYLMSILPPPQFPPGSIEQQAVDAYHSANKTRKIELYEQGACRTVRGHVTYRLRDALQVPALSLTVVRDPIERFVSMYDFVLSMVKKRPGQTGWDNWLSGTPLADEFGNSSSIINHGFYDGNGSWIAHRNIGFSFHFYGVLHQLSGITPVFKGVENPLLFEMSNAAEMAEVAKNNLCSSHILGSQNDMKETLRLYFETLSPFAQWSTEEKEYWDLAEVNRNVNRKSDKVDDYLPPLIRKELERRLHHEIEVVKFAEKIIAYRKSKE